MGTQNPVVFRSGAQRVGTFSNSITLTSPGLTTLLVPPLDTRMYRDLSFLQASNTSNTGVRVDITDGTLTYSWFLAPSGGGFNLCFNPPLPASTAGTGWQANISGPVTDVRVSAQCVEVING